MRRSELRQKVIRRIRRFELKESELDDLIHAGDLRYDPECEEGEPYATILSMIELLPERKRHDLMCLMYLGRNLEYYGLNEEQAVPGRRQRRRWNAVPWAGIIPPVGGRLKL